MGKSFRTQKPEVAARRRLRREPDGTIALPRIVTRQPTRGDQHPLPAAVLGRILRTEVPVEYLNGLQRIELRARPSKEVGEPFAWYLKDEKAVILYSLPLHWYWREYPSEDLLKGMRRFFADVVEEPWGVFVTWPAPEVLSLWFFIEVLAHELGHHFRNQYRVRRGSGRHRRHEEFVADLHSRRFSAAFMKRLRSART